MSFAHPEYLVSTDWLAEHLDDPDVRVFESTVFLRPRDGGGYRVESGRAEYDLGTHPRCGFPRPASRLLGQQPTPALHDAFGGGVRRGRRAAGHLGDLEANPLRPARFDVGGASLVDVPVDGLQERGRARWRLASLERRKVAPRRQTPRLRPPRPSRRQPTSTASPTWPEVKAFAESGGSCLINAARTRPALGRRRRSDVWQSRSHPRFDQRSGDGTDRSGDWLVPVIG